MPGPLGLQPLPLQERGGLTTQTMPLVLPLAETEGVTPGKAKLSGVLDVGVAERVSLST